jgi:hypothetical protein
MSDAARPSGPHGPASAPAPVPPRPRTEYEFSEEHREKFAGLAASMSFVGVCAMLLGMVAGAFAGAAVYAGFAALGGVLAVGAAVGVPTAWWTMSAGRSLSSLVRTRGRDVDHLMAAVAQLRWLFGFARVFVILVTMAMVITAAAAVWCTFGVDKAGRCFGGWG